MKMKQRLLLMTIMIILCGNVSSKLTPEENVERGQQCGKVLNAMNPTITPGKIETGKDEWIVRLKSVDYVWPVLGAVISKKHILATSEMVLKDGTTWIKTSSEMKVTCIDSIGHVQVPADETKFTVTVGECKDPSACQRTLTIEKATIVDTCKPDFKTSGGLMVIEIKEELSSYPCLFGHESKEDDVVEVLGFPKSTNSQFDLSLIQEKISGVTNVISSKKIPQSAEFRVGLVLAHHDSKATLISLATHPDAFRQNFLSVKDRHDGICEIAGVCLISPPTNTPGAETTTEDYKYDSYTPEPEEPTVSYGPVKNLVDLEVEDYDPEQDRIKELNKIIDAENEKWMRQDMFVSDDFFNGSQPLLIYFSLFIVIVFV